MPRDVHAWSGKPLAPTSESALQPTALPAPSVAAQNFSAPATESAPAAPRVSCPNCGGELRALASGALGCMACAAVFQERANADAIRATEPPPGAALDQIDAINAMLRRNTLVLGPGGVPLSESREDDSRGLRRRAEQPRRARR